MVGVRYCIVQRFISGGGVVGAGRLSQLLLTTHVVLLVCVCWGRGDRGREMRILVYVCTYNGNGLCEFRYGSFCVNLTQQCCLNLTRQWLCELDLT